MTNFRVSVDAHSAEDDLWMSRIQAFKIGLSLVWLALTNPWVRLEVRRKQE